MICGLPEPNKLRICQESCFGLQGLERPWGALFSARVALGAKFERFYRGEQSFKQLTQPLQALQIFFGAC